MRGRCPARLRPVCGVAEIPSVVAAKQGWGGGDATLVAELHALLVAAGFGRGEIPAEESSRAAIAQWTDGAAVGEFVVCAFSTAYKLEVG